MINISESAQAHFRKLIEREDLPGMGVRLSAMHAGLPTADVRLEFAEPRDLQGDEWAIDCEGFTLWVDAASVPYRPRAAYAPSVETSVYVAPTHIGRGLGSALYGALLAELEREDVHRAYAGIAMPNPASVRLHERHGYRRAGYYSEQGRKFGRYWHVAWYERSFPEVASTTSG